MCDVGYLCANFSLPRPLCSRLRPHVRDRQTSDAHHRLMTPTLGAGYNKKQKNERQTDIYTKENTVVQNLEYIFDMHVSTGGL